MTDNKKLVEEAAKAIDPGAWYGGVAYDPRWAGEAEHRRIAARRQAHSAFAVFEKALTPTDDEREALADRLARRLIDDPKQLMLAEGTGALHVALSESIRSVIEDVYADCGDSDPGVLSSNIARRLAWDLPPVILADAGFRRSEVSHD